MSTTTSLKRAGPLLAAACAALMLIPAASPAGGPPYPDATGDSSSAGDINGVTVLADKPSGQIVFRISGANLSTSPTSVTLLFVDADANPATGSPSWLGADYVFEVDDTSYDFEHYDGSNWVGTPSFPPAGAARNKGSRSTVYASWDGATKVVSWRVLAGSNAKHLTAVATRRKGPFETPITLSKKYSAFKVQALDSRGHLLGTSNAFTAGNSTAPKTGGGSGGSGSNLVGFY